MPIVALTPDVIYLLFQKMFQPTPSDIVIKKQREALIMARSTQKQPVATELNTSTIEPLKSTPEKEPIIQHTTATKNETPDIKVEAITANN
jgi:hypothetical protein